MHSTQRIMLAISGVLGGLGVIAGAFAAHALKEQLEPASLNTFEVGVRYQIYHAIALLGLCAVPLWSSRWIRCAGWSWVIGVLLFSGSLYGLAFTDWKWLGPVTPLGGVAFIVGWVCVAGAAMSAGKSD